MFLLYLKKYVLVISIVGMTMPVQAGWSDPWSTITQTVSNGIEWATPSIVTKAYNKGANVCYRVKKNIEKRIQQNPIAAVGITAAIVSFVGTAWYNLRNLYGQDVPQNHHRDKLAAMIQPGLMARYEDMRVQRDDERTRAEDLETENFRLAMNREVQLNKQQQEHKATLAKREQVIQRLKDELKDAREEVQALDLEKLRNQVEIDVLTQIMQEDDEEKALLEAALSNAKAEKIRMSQDALAEVEDDFCSLLETAQKRIGVYEAYIERLKNEKKESERRLEWSQGGQQRSEDENSQLWCQIDRLKEEIASREQEQLRSCKEISRECDELFEERTIAMERRHAETKKVREESEAFAQRLDNLLIECKKNREREDEAAGKKKNVNP